MLHIGLESVCLALRIKYCEAEIDVHMFYMSARHVLESQRISEANEFVHYISGLVYVCIFNSTGNYC